MNYSSSIVNRYHIIKKIPLFCKLSWFQRQKIARVSSIVEYKKGDFICRQGDPSEAFYCLIYGRVQAYTVDSEGKKEILSFIRQGMPFGIISIMTGMEHSLNFETVNDSVVLKIRKDEFQRILKAMPQLSVEMSQSLSERIRHKIFAGKSDVSNPVIAVFSPIKGAGVSTYSANLAFHLHRETKKKVILVRLSAERSEPDAASPAKRASVRQGGQLKLADIVGNYDLALSSTNRREPEIEFLHLYYDKDESARMVGIGQFVSTLAHHYRHVVIDLPHEMDKVILETLLQSDVIQLIALDSKEDLQATRQTIYHLEETLRENFSPDRVQVLISGNTQLSFKQVNEAIDFDIFMKLPYIDELTAQASRQFEDIGAVIPAPLHEYGQVVRKIARQASGVSVGIVLGGGAALGIAHIGVIRVLEKENIPIDIVVGSSMGALLGAFWVTGKDAKGLEMLAREFKSPRSLFKLFDPIIPIGGLVGGRSIRRWLKTRGLEDKIFYGTNVPFKVVSYDLLKRQEIVLHSGSLVDAVMKSIAIPGVIKPILEGDNMIIDGGVLNPLPTNVLKDMGVNKIIAVNVLQSPQHVAESWAMEKRKLEEDRKITFLKAPLSFVGFHLGRFFQKLFTPAIADIIVRSLQASEYVIAEQNGKLADVLIHPNLAGINWFELYRVDELIQRGEQAAREALPQIKQLIQPPD